MFLELINSVLTLEREDGTGKTVPSVVSVGSDHPTSSVPSQYVNKREWDLDYSYPSVRLAGCRKGANQLPKGRRI